MKKAFSTISLVLACILLCSVVALAAGGSYTKELIAKYVGVNLVVNGTTITPKDADGNIVEPFIVDGTTYLPVRAVAEALGQEVGWDGNTKTVYIGEQPITSPTTEIAQTANDQDEMATPQSNTPIYTFLKNLTIENGTFQNGNYYYFYDHSKWTYGGYVYTHLLEYQPENNAMSVCITVQGEGNEDTSIYSFYDNNPTQYDFTFAFQPQKGDKIYGIGFFNPSDITASNGGITYLSYSGRASEKQAFTNLIVANIRASFIALDNNLLKGYGYSLADMGFANLLS